MAFNLLGIFKKKGAAAETSPRAYTFKAAPAQKRKRRKPSPSSALCAGYCLLCALAIFLFRLAWPGEEPPLPCFASQWRLIRSALDYLNLFPAVFLSALILPFGFFPRARDAFSPFSPSFLEELKPALSAALAGTVFYALLLFLVTPLARDYEDTLRFKGDLYRLARDKAVQFRDQGEWSEVFEFTAITERIWPGSPEMREMRQESSIRMDHYRVILQRHGDDPEIAAKRRAIPGPASAELSAQTAPFAQAAPAALSPLPGQGGRSGLVNAPEALRAAEEALSRKRYFDAHWLAVLAGRLAKDPSPERSESVRLAAKAWEGVAAMEAAPGEAEARRLFRLKRGGYEAMDRGDWAEAYYTFRELLLLDPSDPDAERFLTKSESGLSETAFFIDEIEEALGEVQTGAFFSLPASPAGRLALRFDSLSVFPDSAWCLGVSLMAFDRDGKALWSMEAPYGKLIPISLGGAGAGGAWAGGAWAGGGAGGAGGQGGKKTSRTALLTRALDRYGRSRERPPVITILAEAPSPLAPPPPTPAAAALLDIPWEDFRLLTEERRGLDNLSPAMLSAAAANLAPYGCLPAVFQAELLYRFAEPFMLLPLSILAIVIGWRYRAWKRPRYMAVPMLAALPAVMNGAVHLCRLLVNNLGVLAVSVLPFPAAVAIFCGGGAIFFFLSLIILASQHG